MSVKSTFRVFWMFLMFVAVVAVATAANLGFREVRTVTRDVEVPAPLTSYDEAVALFGPGEVLDPEQLGAPAGTVCGAWYPSPTVQVVACRL